MTVERHARVRGSSALSPVLLVAVCASCTPRPAIEAASLSHGTLCYDAAVDPDLIVAAELGSRFELRAYDRRTLRRRWRAPLGPPEYDITGVAMRPGGDVWVSSSDGSVRSFARKDGRYQLGWRLDHAASALALTRDLLLTGSRSGNLCVRRLADGALLQCVAAHETELTALAVDQDLLASAGADGSVTLWRLPTLHRLGATKISETITAISLSGRRLAIATADRPLKGLPRRPASGRVLLWNPDTNVVVLGRHGHASTGVSWTGSRELLSSSWDGTVRSWIDDSTGPGAVVQRRDQRIHGLAVGRGAIVSCGWALTPKEPATQVLLKSGHGPWRRR